MTDAELTIFQTCPAGYFSCQNGTITCIQEQYKCDCSSDCEDGSDEQEVYGGCSSTHIVNCMAKASGMFNTIFIVCIIRRGSKFFIKGGGGWENKERVELKYWRKMHVYSRHECIYISIKSPYGCLKTLICLFFPNYRCQDHRLFVPNDIWGHCCFSDMRNSAAIFVKKRLYCIRILQTFNKRKEDL